MTLNSIGELAGHIVYERHGLPDSRPIRALVLAEEVGEAMRAVLKSEQGTRGTAEYWRGELAHELAGVVIAAAAVASQWGIDLDTAVTEQVAWLDSLPPGAWHVVRPPNSSVEGSMSK